jgi:hypothetical protein
MKTDVDRHAYSFLLSLLPIYRFEMYYVYFRLISIENKIKKKISKFSY